MGARPHQGLLKPCLSKRHQQYLPSRFLNRSLQYLPKDSTMDVHAQIEIRDNHLSAQKRFSLVVLIALIVMLVISLLINLALIVGFNSYPKTKWIWTQDAKAVCEAIPLTEPNISQALLADFAARAAISVHTYDYINWRENLSYAVQNY
ncbi:MAG: DotI/IcmL/TraM family protein, partial [Alphaproteobacteria bacterium]|nr:DotI/IcmL/TraM family protein [Alphaproteobacteria bacterium]